jgi:transcriptional regulator GlxA family with amidase domain
MHHVAALLYPRALATSITLPMEILQAAAQVARTRTRRALGVDSRLASPDGQPVALFGGMSLTPDDALGDLPSLELLILPAIWRNPQPVVETALPWRDWLCDVASSGTRVCAVGTGACLLAAAGLLDGRPATTHWNYAQAFARHYPTVDLKHRHLITQSGNLYCVGSVNSIADLMVHIVEDWYGNAVARAVENQFSPEIRRPFRAAAYQTGGVESHHDELVASAQDWLRENIDHPVRLDALAHSLQVSPRTLTRRFRAATGQSPQAWLQQHRIAQARDLLRHTDLAVADIAWRVGLQDSSHFGKLFREHVGMTPKRYREAVRGKLFGPAPA